MSQLSPSPLAVPAQPDEIERATTPSPIMQSPSTPISSSQQPDPTAESLPTHALSSPVDNDSNQHPPPMASDSIKEPSIVDTPVKAVEPIPVVKPSFYEKYFTKPIIGAGDSEKSSAPGRRFSLRSIGFIASALAMLVILAVIAAATAATLVEHHENRHHHHGYDDGSPINPINPLDPSSPTSPNNTNSQVPVRAAIVENFPDPSIWFENGTWYAYATNKGAGIIGGRPHNTTGQDPNSAHGHDRPTDMAYANIQVATSTDYVTWTLRNASKDPLPNLGQWALQGDNQFNLPAANVWAPAIIQRPTDNKYVLYYSAISSVQGDKLPQSVYGGKRGHHPAPHCVGAAISQTDSPLGPFDPVNASIACPLEKGGAIDPAVIRDEDGTIYVAWKVDGNNIGNGGLCGNTVKPILPTPIMLQKMKPDGINADGEPLQILTNNRASDGPLVEAPALVRSAEGIYFLFFSSGCTRARSYDVQYATATSITGPYTRAEKPLLSTGDFGLTAPGSVGIHADGKGGWNMAFHARVLLNEAGIRAMFTSGLKFEKRKVSLVRAVKSGSSA